ncbi:aKG-HExxH-type peptide beta-hydroxylase [Kitasatospora sp. NPDC087315]|uniref:aKG-HExxH-type peptide beta-hydroxylase n=1 Tax=Kitasatospora sp. NPDC087315 TaxID=3364069 RepID=UPI003800461B
MDIEPNAAEAARDQRGVCRLTLGALRRATLAVPAPAPAPVPGADGPAAPPHHPPALAARHPGLTADDLGHPAVIELAHTAQRALRSGPLTPERHDELAARLDTALALARAVPGRDCGGRPWRLELAGPQPHLSRSVARALADTPPAPAAGARNGAAPATSEVRAWTDTERATADEAIRLLAAVWPAMLDELTYTVRQIALLSGEAIEGFTDFTVHGAVFLGRERLTDEPDGLPAPLRLAEALLHEGTHQRCNAALISTPLWHRTAEQGALVATPLRADRRPLGGLFHQMVVLSRSASFYRRLLTGRSGPALDQELLRTRYARHREDVGQAATTLEAHRAALTDEGRRVLARAGAEASA